MLDDPYCQEIPTGVVRSQKLTTALGGEILLYSYAKNKLDRYVVFQSGILGNPFTSNNFIMDIFGITSVTGFSETFKIQTFL